MPLLTFDIPSDMPIKGNYRSVEEVAKKAAVTAVVRKIEKPGKMIFGGVSGSFAYLGYTTDEFKDVLIEVGKQAGFTVRPRSVA